MKTDDLIALLAKDAQPVKRGAVPARLAMFALPAAAVSLVAVALWLGFRDMGEAVSNPTFWMKLLYTAGLAVAGFVLADRLSRPGAKAGTGFFLAAVFVVGILAAAMKEMMGTPPDAMPAAFLGSTWTQCPWRIVVLSIPILAALLWGMRSFAPTRPMLAGFGAGLLAGGLGATVYGLHCGEHAAPFVAIFYSLGMVITGALGALIGSRVLRW